MAAQTYNINIKGDINFEALPKLIEQLNALSAEVAALNKMTFEGMQKSMGDLIAPFIVVSLPRARGERDFVFRLYFRLTTSFNSRAHGGRDNARADEPLQIKFVSIHAPARGATTGSMRIRTRRKFQFTRPRGARRKKWALAGVQSTFQFTRPRGARQQKTQKKGGEIMFQFTRPRGARRADMVKHAPKSAFQFTRPRGARHN